MVEAKAKPENRENGTLEAIKHTNIREKSSYDDGILWIRLLCLKPTSSEYKIPF